MKQLLKERFLAIDYDQILYQQYQHCQQKSKTIREYTEEFYRLNAWVDLYESERQQVSRYLGELKDTIHDQLALQSIWKLSEAVNLAYRVEGNLARNTQRPPYVRKTTFESSVDKPNPNVSYPLGEGSSTSLAPPQSKQAGKAPVQPTKSNPYAKLTPFHCYRCN